MEEIPAENEQELEVAIVGPGGANTLLIYTGAVHVSARLEPGERVVKKSVWFKVGRTLTANQFHEAVATVVPTTSGFVERVNAVYWVIESVDVGRDTASGKVKVEISLQMESNAPEVGSSRLSYQIMVLAEIP